MKADLPRRFLYPIAISVVVLILAFANHISGTWLLGWDSLSDEFNFGINFQRQFFGVWNEYQGLGTAGGHAHASDIPRFIYLWLASFVMPVSILRYSYFFLTLLIGSLGMYFLGKYLFKHRPHKNLLALLATSFYIFNLGTLQIFFVPFEMFNAQFMVLPWIFLYVLKFIRKAKLKDYLLLCLFIFLGTPQGYAPVLYYALIGSVAGFLFVYLLISNDRIKVLLRSIYIGAAFILLNLYWILPNLYYIKNYSDSVSASKINSLFSEEAFLYSTKWGTWLDFPILRGFLFGWLDYKYTTGQNGYLMDFWRGYMANPLVLFIGLLFFAIIIVGIVASILKNKKVLISLIPVFGLWLFMVIGANGILAPIWYYLREHFELFREGLRFPYSKFSILLQFGYSLFFVVGIIFLLDLTNKITPQIKKTILWVLIALPILYMYPFFTGNLISKEMQIKFPIEYRNLFDKFEKENPNKRIVYLPANSLYGWQYYDWGSEGYQGAGFAWFGLAQSFVTRDFDRWHPANEQFYTELQYAIYNEDQELLQYLLKKYDVSYVILDKNIISPNTPQSLFYKETSQLLSKTKDLKLSSTFGNIEVYDFRNPTISENYIEIPKDIVPTREINYEDDYSYYDTNYVAKVVDYYQNNIFDSVDLNKLNDSKEFEINIQNDAKSDPNKTYAVSIPFASRREAIPVEFSLQNSQLQVKYIYPEIYNNKGDAIFTNVPQDLFPAISTGANQILINNVLLKSNDLKFQGLIDESSDIVEFSQTNSGIFDYSDTSYSAVATDCSGGEGGVGKIYNESEKSVGLETEDGLTGCLNFEDRISNSSSVIYKISFDYKNSDAAVPMYCLSDTQTGECHNQQYKSRPELSVEGFNSYEDYVLIDHPEVVRFVLVLASTDQNAAVSGQFKNIKIERFDVKSVRKLLNPALRGLEKNISIKASDFPLKVKLPEYDELSSNYLAGSKKYNSQVGSCDEFSEKSYKRDLINLGGRDAYQYYAEDAISCDTLESSIINTNASYMVTFDTEKLSGQGFDVCFWGINIGKCLLQERLNGGKESYLLPSYTSAGGVNISLNNSSIGRIPTQNNLYGVDVKYLPYAWFKEVAIKDLGNNLVTSADQITVTKKALYQYNIDLTGANLEKGLNLVLNQSFDNGWVLLDLNSCFLGIVSPGFCKTPKSSHFLYNNWANGWHIDNQEDISNYAIIFWPQLLQIGGYLVFALFLAVLSTIYGILSFYGSRRYKT